MPGRPRLGRDLSGIPRRAERRRVGEVKVADLLDRESRVQSGGECVDPDRADLVRWAFEAYATGNYSTRHSTQRHSPTNSDDKQGMFNPRTSRV